MTESSAPFPPPPTPAYVPIAQVVRRPMALRHVGSVAIALALTPLGLALFDYGGDEYLRLRAYRLSEGAGSGTEFALMFLGGLLLMGVAATARLSGLGPILAGILWALVPFLWFLIDLGGFYSTMRDLPTSHFWFSNPPFLFGTVAAMLIGSGLAGRWRGARL